MPTDTVESRARTTRQSLWLFFAYTALYSGFVGLAVFAPATLAATVGGINVAVLYGFFLIAAAPVLALVYVRLRQDEVE